MDEKMEQLLLKILGHVSSEECLKNLRLKRQTARVLKALKRVKEKGV